MNFVISKCFVYLNSISKWNILCQSISLQLFYCLILRNARERDCLCDSIVVPKQPLYSYLAHRCKIEQTPDVFSDQRQRGLRSTTVLVAVLYLRWLLSAIVTSYNLDIKRLVYGRPRSLFFSKLSRILETQIITSNNKGRVPIVRFRVFPPVHKVYGFRVVFLMLLLQKTPWGDHLKSQDNDIKSRGL